MGKFFYPVGKKEWLGICLKGHIHIDTSTSSCIMCVL